MKTLFLITARGGSKGIPKKNIKPLLGKSLLHYSISIARQFASDEDICLSTDDSEIIESARQIKLPVPFVRPLELANDTAGSYEVIMHALNFYKHTGHFFDAVVLLQPTSPLRLKEQLRDALNLFSLTTEAVVSVKESKTNPFSNLFVKSSDGFLEKVMEGKDYERRQDVPATYEVNGAIYIFNVKALEEKHISSLKKTPYLMPAENSVDIDTTMDWAWAEFMLEKKIVKLDYE